MRGWGGTPSLLTTNVLLRTYSGERLNIRGEIKVDVQFWDKKAKLNLLVVVGKGPSMMGRDWISVLQPNFSVLRSSADGSLQSLLDKHAVLFKEELGRIRGVKVKIHVDPKARPLFFKPRPVPYALRARVEEELKRLEAAGIIEPVTHSDWAAPVVPVVKGDGSIRLCGDYKLTVNRVASLEKYPLPRIEDLISSLGKGKVFTKLDLANAYLQIELEQESKKYVTISTHKGLFQYNRLPFGVASAPAIFQHTMESILQGIPAVLVYLDDILVAGSSESEHLQLLEMVMAKLENAGIRLRRSKCLFMLPSIQYLGHHISAEGICPAEDN